MTPDVLIYAEDPGAANFVVQLPGKLKELGVKTLLLADGLAEKVFHERGIAYEIAPRDKGVHEILAFYSPKLLLVGTSENKVSMGLALIDAAKQLGIVSVGFIDMSVNASERFCGTSVNPLKHAPHWLLVPDSESQQCYVKLGYPVENIVVSGHPHFDYVQEKRLQLKLVDKEQLGQKVFPDAPSGRLVVVFVAEPLSSLNLAASRYVPEYTFTGRGKSEGRTFIVLEEVLDALAAVEPKPFIVVRLHPKNKLEDFEQYKDEVDAFSYGQDPLEVVWAADVVVGMSSMLLAESVLLGKPTLAVLPRDSERKWLAGAVSEYIPVVTNRQGLQDICSDWLGKLMRSEKIQHKPYVVDQSDDSLARVVSFIQRQLANQQPRPLIEDDKLILRPFSKDCIT
ncbi:MAG: hypothetical protein HY711_06410, partial [Candidatus Melainabacteria bacterium]|nr:hypothetical protein [Candidatus Melainabacteria bacterium]